MVVPVLAGGAAASGALVETLGTLLAVVVGALLHWGFTVWAKRDAARVEKKKDIELRIWEVRRVGYSVVLRGLDQLSETAYEIAEMYQGRPPQEDERGSSAYSATSGSTWPECQAEFARNQLVFSTEFVRAFQNLENNLKQAGLQMDPRTIADGEARAFGKAHTDLRRIALKDLDLNESDPEH